MGEPNINPAFLTLDNVTLLPHVGSASCTRRDAMGQLVVDNLAAYVDAQAAQDTGARRRRSRAGELDDGRCGSRHSPSAADTHARRRSSAGLREVLLKRAADGAVLTRHARDRTCVMEFWKLTTEPIRARKQSSQSGH